MRGFAGSGPAKGFAGYSSTAEKKGRVAPGDCSPRAPADPVKWDASIPDFLVLPLLRHPGQLSGRGSHLERLAPQGPRATPVEAERRRKLGRPSRHRRIQRGRCGPQQGLLDCNGHARPRDLHALPAGVSTVAVGRVSAAQPTGVRAMPKNRVHRIDLAKQAIRFRLDASNQLRRGVIS